MYRLLNNKSDISVEDQFIIKDFKDSFALWLPIILCFKKYARTQNKYPLEESHNYQLWTLIEDLEMRSPFKK